MKIKSLILALPVLCFACGTATDTSDPAYQESASPILSKRVAGVQTLTSNAIYDDPCHILGEEYVRSALNLDEKTEISEVAQHDGCEFEWAGNKVQVSFNGYKPYPSIDFASYNFDKLYQNKPAKAAAPVVEPTEVAPETEGTAAETEAAGKEHKAEEPKQSHPSPGITSATAHHTEAAVSQGSYEAISGVGDKAVWNSTTGALHVLYVNHIINVTVESKGKEEVRKEQAQKIAEVLLEKIAANEYTRQL